MLFKKKTSLLWQSMLYCMGNAPLWYLKNSSYGYTYVGISAFVDCHESFLSILTMTQQRQTLPPCATEAKATRADNVHSRESFGVNHVVPLNSFLEDDNNVSRTSWCPKTIFFSFQSRCIFVPFFPHRLKQIKNKRVWDLCTRSQRIPSQASLLREYISKLFYPKEQWCVFIARHLKNLYGI